MDEKECHLRKRLLTTSILFVFVFVYLIIGATLFSISEYNSRNVDIENAVDKLEQERAHLLKVLWASSMWSTNEHDFKFVANERLDFYEKAIVGYVKDNININYPDDTLNQWHFAGAIFYCFSLVTTIGYGTVHPQTDFGKMLTVVYATFGIPLTLLLLHEISEVLTFLIKLCVEKLRSNKGSRLEFILNSFATTAWAMAYLLPSSIVFSFLEGWNLLDASYFSFLRFSTIGSGDFEPEHVDYTIFFLLFNLIALSLCSLCFLSIRRSLEGYATFALQNLEMWLHKRRKTRQLRRLGNIISNGFKKPLNNTLKPAPLKHRLLYSRVTEEDDNYEGFED